MESETVKCTKCTSTWFEQVELGQYQVNAVMVLGQHIPVAKNTMKFIMLKCCSCGQWMEPRIQHDNIVSPATKLYNDLLDTLEGKKNPGTV
jgi:transcription elongation factor Elf1